MKALRWLAVALALCVGAATCASGDDDDDGADGDGDSDVDSDSDTDSDSDADTDSDTDADGDADLDCAGDGICPEGYECACWDVGPRSVCNCGLTCASDDQCTDEGSEVCCPDDGRNAGICTSGGCACAYCE